MSMTDLRPFCPSGLCWTAHLISRCSEQSLHQIYSHFINALQYTIATDTRMFAELKVNPYNLSVVIFVALGTISTAYGLAIIGSTVGQPNFYTYFDLATAGEPGKPTSYS